MLNDALSRRAFVGAATAITAAWVGARPEELHEAGVYAVERLHAGPNASAAFEVLTPSQAADIEAFTSHIIPTDDTPGAREAGVVHFIDHSLATFAAGQKQDMTDGLVALNALVKKQFPNAVSFSKLTSAQQLTVVALCEKQLPAFFENLRTATVIGMLSNPSYGGNANKTGWKLIGFDDRGLWSPPFGFYDRPENMHG